MSSLSVLIPTNTETILINTETTLNHSHLIDTVFSLLAGCLNRLECVSNSGSMMLYFTSIIVDLVPVIITWIVAMVAFLGLWFVDDHCHPFPLHINSTLLFNLISSSPYPSMSRGNHSIRITHSPHFILSGLLLSPLLLFLFSSHTSIFLLQSILSTETIFA